MDIAQSNIVKLRRDPGWSQETLALIAGISERTIQRIERTGSCSLDTKLALATAFEISPVGLLGTDEESDFVPVSYKTSIGGIIGLFILGLTAPLLVLLTGQNGL